MIYLGEISLRKSGPSASLPRRTAYEGFHGSWTPDLRSVMDLSRD